MKKSILFILSSIFTIFTLLLLTGCGEIATKDELIKYAKKKYGQAECINFTSTEENSEATFKDKEFGFTYQVTSYKQKFEIDGATFGEYENKNSDFNIKYIEEIKNRTQTSLDEIAKKYNITIKWNTSYLEYINASMTLLHVYFNNTSNYEETLLKIAEVVDKTDTRDYLSEALIDAEYNGEFVGEYSFEDNKFRNKEEYVAENMLESAYRVMKYNYNLKIKNKSELKYIKSVTMDQKEIPGLEDERYVSRITDTKESLKNVTVVYYKYKGETWIVADILANNGYLHVYKLEN